MYYVKIELAMDSEDVDHVEYKSNYDKYIDQIGNKADAEKQGHFYIVKEAKLIEISAVLEGSNTITPTLDLTIENLTISDFDIKTNTLYNLQSFASFTYGNQDDTSLSNTHSNINGRPSGAPVNPLSSVPTSIPIAVPEPTKPLFEHEPHATL